MWWILAIIIVLIGFYGNWGRSIYWKKYNIAYDFGYPIIGTFWKSVLQLEHLIDSQKSVYNKYPNKQCVGIRIFGDPYLFVRDPEMIKLLTVKDFHHFVDHEMSFINDDLDPLFSKVLINLKGERWREIRSTISPVFTSSKMKFMFRLVNECGEQFANYYLEEIKNKSGKNQIIEVDAKDMFSRLTSDIIATCAFGIKIDSLKDRDNEFFQIGVESSKFSATRAFFIIMMPWLLKILGIGLMPKYINKFVENIIEENIRSREESRIIRPDVIHLLLEARKGDKDNDDNAKVNEENEYFNKHKKVDLTNEDIAAQAFIFIVAGYETTSTGLLFIAYELALNKDVQRKLLEEIDKVNSDCNGNVNYEALQKLTYMDMVISESFRKWPQIGGVDRLCTKPYLLKTEDGDVYIEKNIKLLLPICAIQNDPKYFPHPEKFDPERFNDENKHNILPFTYAPFGYGPRACIGQRFALMSTKILLFHLLRKFEITATDKTPMSIVFSPKALFTLTPTKKIYLGLKQRTIIHT